MADLDLRPLGNLTAELMERIEEVPEEAEDVEIGVCAVVVELTYTWEGDRATRITYRCTDPRRWVQAGFFAQAKRGVFAS